MPKKVKKRQPKPSMDSSTHRMMRTASTQEWGDAIAKVIGASEAFQLADQTFKASIREFSAFVKEKVGW